MSCISNKNFQFKIIYIIVGLFIILSASILFFIPYKPVPQVVYTDTIPKDVDWNKSMPAIFQSFKTEFLGSRAGETSPVKIYKTGDITGDGLSEAIVDMGVEAAGPGDDFMKLMMLENNKVVTPGFRLKNGNYVSEYPFEIGLVINTITDVDFLPSKNTIYKTIKYNSSYYTNCLIEAYQWNPNTKTFDFSQLLSDEIKIGVCK